MEDDSGPGANKIPAIVVLFICELTGTAILLFFGCMGVCVQMVHLPVVPHLPGISFGLAVMIALQLFGHVSGGHVNPQVTIAALILGKIKPIYVPVYIIAQFIGGVLGMGLLKLMTPKVYYNDLCVTTPHNFVGTTQAIVIEIAITCIVALFLGAILDKRNSDKFDSMSLRFGLAIACLAMVAGPYTGAGLNTVRSFAPALMSNNWKGQWIYWVGPTVGCVLGATFYRFIVEPPITP